MQAFLQRNDFTKWVILNKVCISKAMFENEYQMLFHKSILSDFEGLIFKPYLYFALCK
jgi:hypothetical protein